MRLRQAAVERALKAISASDKVRTPPVHDSHGSIRTP